MAAKHLLVVDDEPIMGDFLCEAGEQCGFTVTRVDTIRKAREKIGSQNFEAAFMDIRLPDGDGLSILSDVRAKHPRCHICVITAYGTVDTAVSAMKLGADDFLMKPFSVTDVERVLARCGQRPPRESSGEGGGFAVPIVTGDPKMQGLLDLVERVAPTDASILITGESGTGKELIARNLHHSSARNDFPFVAVNCSAIPENLLEAELFGYEKGAFTGAERRKLGLVEIASGGTLFLDEVAELPMMLQPKLLRVLEGGEFRRVGGNETLRADIRVVAATNKNLSEMVKQAQFREDLFYRLNVIPVHIPPLRERPSDIPVLAEHFLREYGPKYGKPDMSISAAAKASLLMYAWPGNVRELENTVQRTVALAQENIIESFHLSDSSLLTQGGTSSAEHHVGVADFDALIETYEKALLTEALRRAKGSQTDAAQLLGLKRTTLLMKLKKYGMDSAQQ